MSLPNYLSKIKSAGIYRFVFDKSEVPGNDAETLRLVVGYSEKGPFNTLVYIESVSEFEKIFGGVNKKLERRGCFFHRMAEQALASGPILAINLKPFTDEEVKAASFNVTENVSEHLASLGIEDIYDTTRFWYLEPEGLGERFAEKYSEEPRYITVTSTDSKETTNTIFFRGYHPKGYDISFKEWYSSVLNGEELPSYMEGHEMDKVSEYFAECYIFHGEFTPEIATSEALSKYFDVDGRNVTIKPYILNAFGEKRDTLAALAQDTNSNFVNSYSGILLPNFMTSSGSYISLDLMFNAGNDLHKMMMNLNVDALYDGKISIDELNTTGWEQVAEEIKETAIGSISVNAMSAESITPVNSNATFNRGTGEWSYTDALPETYTDPDFYSFDADDASASGYSITFGPEFAQVGTTGDKFILRTVDEKNLAVLTKTEEGSDYETPSDTKSKIVMTISEGSTATSTLTADDLSFITGTPYAKQVYATEMDITDGGVANIQITVPDDFDSSSNTLAAGILTVEGSTTTANIVKLTAGTGDDAKKYKINSDLSTAIGAAGKVNVVLYTDKPGNYAVQLKTTSGSFQKTAKNIKFLDPQKSIVMTFDRSIDTTAANASDGLFRHALVRCNHPVFETCQGLTPVALNGYTYGLKLPSSDMMDKLRWQKTILDTLTKYEGIRLALTNRKDSEYHYLVDTFESFIDTELKSTFGVIAKEKDNCLALVNFPSMKSFKDCPYSSYTDQNGKFQTKYIADGYNKQKPASVYFSLMSEFNGASFVSYNTPVVLTDGTVKTYCPSAALVSNNFMAKYDTRLPYSIVAGPTYGRITASGLVGPDFNFSRQDLDILEPMGVNCMVYVPRKGTYINSNQTAKQNPVTALSKINVRELVIFLQDEIENLMQNYQWEYNTQELRDTIKSKADTICEKIKANGGLYEYINVCDDSNNTPEVIDNEMIILDTSIEPGRGAGKMVQRLYIYRTGALKAMMS